MVGWEEEFTVSLQETRGTERDRRRRILLNHDYHNEAHLELWRKHFGTYRSLRRSGLRQNEVRVEETQLGVC